MRERGLGTGVTTFLLWCWPVKARVQERLTSFWEENQSLATHIRDQLAQYEAGLMDLREALNQAVNTTREADELNSRNQERLKEALVSAPALCSCLLLSRPVFYMPDFDQLFPFSVFSLPPTLSISPRIHFVLSAYQPCSLQSHPLPALCPPIPPSLLYLLALTPSLLVLPSSLFLALDPPPSFPCSPLLPPSSLPLLSPPPVLPSPALPSPCPSLPHDA